MAITQETVTEWLERLSTSNTSSEQDSAGMQGLLRKMGFAQAVVVLGVVYPDGSGHPPLSIQAMAKLILDSISR